MDLPFSLISMRELCKKGDLFGLDCLVDTTREERHRKSFSSFYLLVLFIGHMHALYLHVCLHVIYHMVYMPMHACACHMHAINIMKIPLFLWQIRKSHVLLSFLKHIRERERKAADVEERSQKRTCCFH